MKMTRGRGRLRKAAQGRQEYPYAPPVQSRYATRSSRANVAPQLLATPPSGSNPCLRPAMRILKEGQGTSEPELQHCSSKPPIGDDPVFEKSVGKDEKPFISNSSTIAIPPSGSNPCLRPAMRILKEGQGTSEPELQHCSSKPPIGDDPVFEKSVGKDEKPFISNSSTNISGPHSNHEIDLDALCAKITSQIEEIQEAALQQESHEDPNGDLQPPKENPLVQCDATTDAPPTNPSLSRCHSPNMTEFAMGFKQKLDDDSEEITSAPRLGYEYVHGHEVKTEIAGLVKAIFGKYGNITSECKVKSPSIFSFLLERMCDVYQTLERKILYDLTPTDITIMRAELQLCEDHKLNVAWLVKRLEQISESTSSSDEYLMLKKEAEKCLKSKRELEKKVERSWNHVSLIQNDITTKEQKILDIEAKASRYTERAIKIRTKAKALGSQSLVHGLL